MNWIILTALSLTHPGAPALADTRTVGNGGSVVQCGDSIELLDFYEARLLRQTKVSLGAPGLSVSDKLWLATRRFSDFDPVRASAILDEANGEFLRHARFLDNVNLRNV